MTVATLALTLALAAGTDVPGPLPAPPLPPPPIQAGGFKPAPPPGTARGKGKLLRVGVPEPQVVGAVSPREQAVLTQALVSEVRKLDGLTAVGMAEIREMLTQEYRRQMLGCTASQECLAEIAGALGVDELVSSELAVDGGVSTFTVSRIDLRTTKVIASANQRLSRRRSGEEVLGALGETVERVFHDKPLKAGETRGVAPQVARWLNPPPLPKWAFFATAGAAAMAAAGGGAYALVSNNTRAEHNDLLARGGVVSGAELSRLRSQAEDQQARATLLLGVAGGFAVAAAVEAFFTDWHDDRAAVVVTPRGATVRVRF